MIESQTQQSQEKQAAKRRPYEAPAVIFSTVITTRAGSPLSIGGDPEGVDPMDLFGN